jgi:hypothetical protein
MLNFVKIRPVLTELVRAGGHTDGRSGRQTDMAKLIVDFRTIANAPKNGFAYHNIFLSPFAYSMNSAHCMLLRMLR